MSEAAASVSSDRSLRDPDGDRLGYATFARNLAAAITQIDDPEGLVIGLYGPWGAGKSTVVNFVRFYLERDFGDPVVFISFNPWWFSGQEDLTRAFFGELRSTLETRRVRVEDLVDRLGDLAERVSEAPVPYVGWGKSGAKLARKMSGRGGDVRATKERIAQLLKQGDRRLLIAIDDIDRLTAEELRQLFRLIKAVADFPNVIYLLALDKRVAVRALTDLQSIPGDEYLEKIVQVPFELPLPGRPELRAMLFERLNIILEGTPESLFDPVDWGNVYLDGIDPFIRTPRDVIRLTNTLAVTYPPLRGEVNAVDFVGIETLRVFAPEVYDVIRRNTIAFVGQ